MEMEAPPSSKILETPEQKQERISWNQRKYVRAPWIKASVHLAEHIPHLWKQKTNNDIPVENVMKPREQPVGQGSDAFPQQPHIHTPPGMYEGQGPEGAR